MKKKPQRADLAINHFGGIQALADALDCSSQAIHMWKGVVPELRAYQLEVITAGELSRVDLRPDVFSHSAVA